jgi:hypothetical protein
VKTGELKTKQGSKPRFTKESLVRTTLKKGMKVFVLLARNGDVTVIRVSKLGTITKGKGKGKGTREEEKRTEKPGTNKSRTEER